MIKRDNKLNNYVKMLSKDRKFMNQAVNEYNKSNIRGIIKNVYTENKKE